MILPTKSLAQFSILKPESVNFRTRPVICRTFGPAMKTDDELGHCELCYVGASDEEVAALEMHPDPNNLEAALVEELQKTTGESGETIIAFALVRG